MKLKTALVISLLLCCLLAINGCTSSSESLSDGRIKVEIDKIEMSPSYVNESVAPLQAGEEYFIITATITDIISGRLVYSISVPGDKSYSLSETPYDKLPTLIDSENKEYKGQGIATSEVEMEISGEGWFFSEGYTTDFIFTVPQDMTPSQFYFFYIHQESSGENKVDWYQISVDLE